MKPPREWIEARLHELQAILPASERKRSGLIDIFQREVWDAPSEWADPILDVFVDLAYDLDYFVANPEWRREDPSYYGEKRLEEEVRRALARIDELRQR